MNGAGDNFLAAAGWAGDKHRSLARRQQAPQAIYGLHDAGVADHPRQRISRQRINESALVAEKGPVFVIHCRAQFDGRGRSLRREVRVLVMFAWFTTTLWIEQHHFDSGITLADGVAEFLRIKIRKAAVEKDHLPKAA